MSLSDVIRNIAKTVTNKDELKEKAKDLPLLVIQTTLSAAGQALLVVDRMKNSIKGLGKKEEREEETYDSRPSVADQVAVPQVSEEDKPARKEPVIFAPRPGASEPNGVAKTKPDPVIFAPATKTEPAAPAAEPTTKTETETAPKPATGTETAPAESKAAATATEAQPATTPEPAATVTEAEPVTAPEPAAPVAEPKAAATTEAEPAVAEPAAEVKATTAAATEPAVEEKPAVEAKPAAEAKPKAKRATRKAAAPAVAEEPAAAPAPAAAEGLVEPLPGYDEMTVASLRARMRGKTAEQIGDFLAYERATKARPEVVRMFENRLAKLQAGE